jgi:hypothetical protein
MTARFALGMVCPDCMVAYSVELLNATTDDDGTVRGYVSSAADFCDACESGNVERLGLTAVSA